MNTLEEFDTQFLEQIVKQCDLIVYNDDFNTFDYVIESLMEVCNHSIEQATQCTFLIHFKGKCQVKIGEYDKLKPMCEALLERGITAGIE